MLLSSPWEVIFTDSSLSGWWDLLFPNCVRHQYSGTESHKADSPTLDPSSTWSANKNTVRKRHGCGLYKPPRGSQESGSFKSLTYSWTENHVSTLSAIYIPGVENWQTDFLNCLCLDSVNSPFTPRSSEALLEVGNTRCGYHDLQIQ